MKTNKVVSYIKQQLSITKPISLTKQYSYIKSHNLTRKINYTSITLFSLLALAILFPLGKGEQTTEAVDGTTSTTDSSLSIVFSSTTASVDLTVKDENGTFASSDDTDSSIEFSVSTTNYSGYTLSITGSNDTGELVGTNNPNNALKSITDPITEEAFKDPNNTQFNGYWGYKPSKIKSQDNSNYLPAPMSGSIELDVTNLNNAFFKDYNITIGGRGDYEVRENTYTGIFNIIVTANPFFETGYIQNYSISQCYHDAFSKSVILADARDGEKYSVRYIDGNCWMTSNLRYDLSNNILYPETSDVSSITEIKAVNSMDYSYEEPYYHITSNSGTYLYNYTAATAGSIVGSSTSEATSSICPAGWRLPSYTEINTLVGEAHSSEEYTNPISFSPQFGGLFKEGEEFRDSGYWNDRRGYWWSSTASNEYKRYYLYGSRGHNDYQEYDWFRLRTDSYGRYYGLSVRCVAKNGTQEPITEADTMQELTSEQCANSSNGAITSLRDTRSNTYYTVAKIEDNCWMTQNLALKPGSVLNVQNSNIVDPDDPDNPNSTYIWTLPSTPFTGGGSYTEPQVECSSDVQYGCYYNYAAATAGTIVADPDVDPNNANNTMPAKYDLCPSGWQMPSYTQIRTLVNSTGDLGRSDSIFMPVAAGYYNFYDSDLFEGAQGHFWTSNVENADDKRWRFTLRYSLEYELPGGSLSSRGTLRRNGLSIRCVLSN